jgi:hypothetical protein
MSLYVDPPFIASDTPTVPYCMRGREVCHLIADTDDELMKYSRRLKLKASWIQRSGTPLVHFDITGWILQRVRRDPNVIKLDKRSFALKIHEKVKKHLDKV